MIASWEFALLWIGELVHAFTWMQKPVHLKVYKLGCDKKLQSFTSQVNLAHISMHWTQDPHWRPVTSNTVRSRFLLRQREKSQEVVILNPRCHWPMWTHGRANKKCPLVAKYTDDGQLMEGRITGGIRGFVFVQNITAVAHKHTSVRASVCVCTRFHAQTNTSRLCGFNFSSSFPATAGNLFLPPKRRLIEHILWVYSLRWSRIRPSGSCNTNTHTHRQANEALIFGGTIQITSIGPLLLY